MADIFISYRRGDAAWAGWFATELEKHFSIFIDKQRKSIGLGQKFSERIEGALNECRVCLVLIGPKWINNWNIKRLYDLRDWVRREIIIAIARDPAILVVPIFVGNVTRLDVDRLPPELRPLLSFNGLIFTADRSKTDFEDLVRAIKDWLTSHQGPLSARKSIPDALLYLCDRVEQQDALVDMVTRSKATRRAYVAIVHGHMWECHDGVLERLRCKGVIEDLFKASEVGYLTCLLQWNREAARAKKYSELIRNALKSEALQVPSATDEELYEFLSKRLQPMIAIIEVTWADIEFCGPALVRRLAMAWQTLFTKTLSSGSPVQGSFGMPALLWINVSYENDTQSLTGAKRPTLLPLLTPLTQGHVREWLRIPDVKRAAVGHERELLALPDDEEYRLEKGKIRMLSFMDAVRGMLGSPSPENEREEDRVHQEYR